MPGDAVDDGTDGGHRNAVCSLSFSRDGRLLASAGHDNLVKVWDVGERRLLRTLRVARKFDALDSVGLVGFGPDGRTAVIQTDSAVLIWPPDGPTRPVPGWYGVLFPTIDGRTLAVAGNRVTIWDLTGPRRLRELIAGGPSGATQDGAIGGDAVAVLADDRLSVVSVSSGAMRWAADLRAHAEGPGTLAFSPDGSILAVGAVFEAPEVRDARSGAIIARPGHPIARLHGQRLLAFSPDGRSLAGGGNSGIVTLWDAETWRPRFDLLAPGVRVRTQDPPGTRPGTHASWVRALAFSPDGSLLATAGSDHEIRLWDPATGKLAGSLGAPRDGVTGVAVSADGSLIAARHERGAIRLWDGAGGRLLASREAAPGGRAPIALDPRRPRVFTGHRDGPVQVWSVPGLEPLGAIGGPDLRAPCVAVSSDGSRLAWWGARLDGQRRVQHMGIRDLDAGVPLAAIEDGSEWQERWESRETLDISRHGKLVARLRGHGVGIWDAATGAFVRALEPVEKDSIGAIAFSPAGELLAGGDTGMNVAFWDVATGETRRPLRALDDEIGCIAFSPDGRKLALSTCYSQFVWIHEVATGRLLGILEEHLNHIEAIAWPAGGGRIVTGGADGLVKVWDAESLREVATLVPPA